MTPERELNESGEKATVTGIIFSKRKGGILSQKEQIFSKRKEEMYPYANMEIYL